MRHRAYHRRSTLGSHSPARLGFGSWRDELHLPRQRLRREVLQQALYQEANAARKEGPMRVHGLQWDVRCPPRGQDTAQGARIHRLDGEEARQQRDAGALDGYALASRLSYFLWSSMPDETLFRLAAEHKLRDPAVMRAQVERMLKDPKAEAFVQNFTTTWLRLDKLGKMPPEKGGPFRFYHDRRMEPMLSKQAAAFFADVLVRNERITTFIHSDHTYLNAHIARWMYNRDDVPGEGMIRVPTHDPRRGGILTMPAVMTATANGVDTSPIVRGVWLLENILGTPPSPPPPDVEPLSPDLRGAKTIREQLELHRKHEACASCHRKIDPMGFAFENFDPVGRWRTNYRTNGRPKIDATTELPNGDQLADIVAFKQMLLKREPDFARCLTEKMLTYATGRRLEPIDRGEVNKITTALAKNGNRLRDLVHLVATSEIFLRK